MSNFDRCLAFVLTQEGGYQAAVSDSGNWYDGKLIGTNKGISAPVLAAWWGRAPTADEMRALDDDTVAAIYGCQYWNAVRGGSLPAGVDLSVFDAAVNTGVARSAKQLQQVVGAYQDGSIGPATLAAVAKMSASWIIGRLAQVQTAYYRSIGGPFLNGWLARVERREEAATALLAPVTSDDLNAGQLEHPGTI